MNRDQASNLLVELINHGVRRGAYSSVEVNAINQALEALQSPINTEQDGIKETDNSGTTGR